MLIIIFPLSRTSKNIDVNGNDDEDDDDDDDDNHDDDDDDGDVDEGDDAPDVVGISVVLVRNVVTFISSFPPLVNGLLDAVDASRRVIIKLPDEA